MAENDGGKSDAPGKRGGNEILSVAQMYQADEAAITAGISGRNLMEAAGRAVAEAIQERWHPVPVSVLCGPGNNGGDGFVAARYLSQAGWPVRVGLLGGVEALSGDAAWAADGWTGVIEPLGSVVGKDTELVIDAIFGAGLGRPLDGEVLTTLKAVRQTPAQVVSVDIPSGVEGDTGCICGASYDQKPMDSTNWINAFRANLTVTFFRKKPAHLLFPGRDLCGDVVVADIGIPDAVFHQIDVSVAENNPQIWRDALRIPTATDHKYDRGHLLVIGGAEMTGAGRLAARAALRAGAGMVTVACPPDAIEAYARDTAALICCGIEHADQIAALVSGRKVSAVVVGPGLGISAGTAQMVEAILALEIPTVLDADALSVFGTGLGKDPENLLRMIKGPTVLTPHDGEFSRLFEEKGDRLNRARSAAVRSSAIMLLKGADTVVASPDGPATINSNAPPWLATAGAGDVLSGIVGSLMAQKVAEFHAASAAVWIHGAAAAAFGPGMIADDLPDLLPQIIGKLWV